MYVGLTPSVENSNSTKRSVPLEQEFSGGLPLNLSAALAPPGSRTDGFWARTGTVALLGLQASRRLQIPNVIPHKRSLSPPPPHSIPLHIGLLLFLWRTRLWKATSITRSYNGEGRRRVPNTQKRCDFVSPPPDSLEQALNRHGGRGRVL